MNDRLADRQHIGDLLREGKEHQEIAALMQCSTSTVAKIAGELGLQTRRNKQYVKLSKEEWEEVIERFNNGETPTELSAEYGVSRPAIYARVNK